MHVGIARARGRNHHAAAGAKGYANRLGVRALPALRTRLAFEPTLIRAALVAVAIAATNHALAEIDVSQADAR